METQQTRRRTQKSPTRTKSIEDDRRIEEIIQERLVGLHNGNIMDETNPLTEEDEGLDENNGDGPDSEVFAPPGFQNRIPLRVKRKEVAENVNKGRSRSRKTRKRRGGVPPQGLKLKERLVGNSRDPHKNDKRKKKKECVWSECEDWREKEGSDDEIEDVEEEAENTWRSGVKAGLVVDDDKRSIWYSKKKLTETYT
ncbi:hypothetical protein PIB30_013010 [Stylosanthes scabra]|uniref:Uncharacterized protein n=1 Tax=Stylosanthes scabra TaxID=79078 RepID=A0ABU6R6H8_9FABA|nr:hypothetical protein [Stylosanthes scabra]